MHLKTLRWEIIFWLDNKEYYWLLLVLLKNKNVKDYFQSEFTTFSYFSLFFEIVNCLVQIICILIISLALKRWTATYTYVTNEVYELFYVLNLLPYTKKRKCLHWTDYESTIYQNAKNLTNDDLQNVYLWFINVLI